MTTRTLWNVVETGVVVGVGGALVWAVAGGFVYVFSMWLIRKFHPEKQE